VSLSPVRDSGSLACSPLGEGTYLRHTGVCARISEEPESRALGKGNMNNVIFTIFAYSFILFIGICVTAAQVMNLRDRRKRNKR